MSSGAGPTLFERVLIVPQAHVRIASASFQLEMYALFHRTAGGRLGHIAGSAAMLLAALTSITTLGSPVGLVLSLGLALALGAWGATYDRLVGAATFGYAAALAGAAHALASVLGERAPRCSLALVFSGCAVQTFSHLFEDVPPPHSGTERFVPIAQWIRRIGVGEIVRSTALTAGVFYWLEMWSTPRIIPLQVFDTLLRLGYRPTLRQVIAGRVEEILAEPASDWRRPRARGVLEESAT